MVKIIKTVYVWTKRITVLGGMAWNGQTCGVRMSTVLLQMDWTENILCPKYAALLDLP
jgi:hypothetical protein